MSAMRCALLMPVRAPAAGALGSFFLPGAGIELFAVLARPLFHAVRQLKPVIAGELARNRAQLQPVVRDLDGLYFSPDR